MSAVLVSDVDKRLLRTTKFPAEFNVKVDMTKVNIPVIKKWVSDELAKILQNDDDVVTELVFNIVEGTKNVGLRESWVRVTGVTANVERQPNPKELQIALGGFLEKDAPNFAKELWKLCISGQNSPQGIPKELLEAKKLELIQERVSRGCNCRAKIMLTSSIAGRGQSTRGGHKARRGRSRTRSRAYSYA